MERFTNQLERFRIAAIESDALLDPPAEPVFAERRVSSAGNDQRQDQDAAYNKVIPREKSSIRPNCQTTAERSGHSQ